MADSQLAEFIAMLKTDPDLKEKVLEAEKKATDAAEHLEHKLAAQRSDNIEAVVKIAKHAGFDIEGELGRPEGLHAPTDGGIESPDCPLTCCLLRTSASRAPVRRM